MAQQTIDSNERAMVYTPTGETAEIKLTPGIVRDYLTKPTRSGAVATKADIYKFMMLCQARELNPWVGDAYLVGYDSKDGPQFSLITAVQALHKRAETNPHFDGMESGVIVVGKGSAGIIERPGCFTLPGETVVGGWAKVFRKDRRVPVYASISMAARQKQTGVWRSDPSGMIVKCCEAEVLRKGFPNQVSALYISEEMPDQPPINISVAGSPQDAEPKRMESRSDALASKMDSPTAKPAAQASNPEPSAEAKPADPKPKRRGRPKKKQEPAVEPSGASNPAAEAKPEPSAPASNPAAEEQEPAAEEQEPEFGTVPDGAAEGWPEKPAPADDDEFAGGPFDDGDDGDDEPPPSNGFGSLKMRLVSAGSKDAARSVWNETQQMKLAGRLTDSEYEELKGIAQTKISG